MKKCFVFWWLKECYQFFWKLIYFFEGFHSLRLNLASFRGVPTIVFSYPFIFFINILKEKLRFHKSLYWFLFPLFHLTDYPAFQLMISLQLIGELLFLIAIALILLNYFLSTSLTDSFSIQPTFAFPLKFYWIPKLTLKNYAC